MSSLIVVGIMYKVDVKLGESVVSVALLAKFSHKVPLSQLPCDIVWGFYLIAAAQILLCDPEAPSLVRNGHAELLLVDIMSLSLGDEI